jgi:hypothetical protein
VSERDFTVTCKLCGRDAPFVDAHIVPASFFRDVQMPRGEVMRMVSNDPALYPKRTPIGVYDAQLMCEDCEKLFGPWDAYAASFFIQREAEFFQHRQIEGESVYCAIDFDYERLRLFVLSLLWRAAESTHPYFQRIDLTARRPRLRELLLSGSIGEVAEFSTVIARWRSNTRPDEYAKLQANPFEYRGLETGVRMTRFYLNRFVLDVQVDKSPAPPSVRFLRVEPGRLLLVPERNLESSKDLGALRPAIETYGKRRKR